MTDGEPEAESSWPPGAAFAPGTGVAAACETCGRAWRVHESLAGFRLMCRCGAWVAVAALRPERLLPGASGPSELATAGDDDLAFADSSAPLTPPPRDLARMKSWDGGPLRPDRDGSWTLRHASVEDRTRWTQRTVLELVLILACFWVPALVLYFATHGTQRVLLLPVASIVSSIFVLAVAGSWRAKAFEGLRAAAPRYFVEAGAVAAGAGVVALLYVHWLSQALPNLESESFADARAEWGLGLLLFVVSLSPGIFEELAFRGLLQARLATLLGTGQGAVVGGAAFALAHGITLGLPFHWGLGVYLSYLRVRSDSLVPGMLCHALYNGILVVVLSSG